MGETLATALWRVETTYSRAKIAGMVMFADNTVFVIGAGASSELGLPLGWELMNTIRRNSDRRARGDEITLGASMIMSCILDRHEQSFSYEPRFLAMDEIKRSIDFAGSIDEFINRHYDDQIIAEVGKLQIAYAISQAEAQGQWAMPFFDGPDWMKQQRKPSDVWLYTFTKLLIEGVRNDRVEDVGKNITIICFNYDRCIEEYLIQALQTAFRGVDVRLARKIVEEIEILHPYGTLGPLARHPYGYNADISKLQAMSESIVTWSESNAGRMKRDIEDRMRNAVKIVFLGFAFAPQNMQLLDALKPKRFADEITIYATGIGYNRVIDTNLKSRIADIFSEAPVDLHNIFIQYDLGCNDLLRSHSIALLA